MSGEDGDDGVVQPPTRHELRAARRRAHEIEKEHRQKPSRGGKGDKKGKGQQPGDDDSGHRR